MKPDQFAARIRAIFEANAQGADLRREEIREAELRALVEARLGDKHKADTSRIVKTLLRIQTELENRQSSLVDALNRSKISPEAYVASINTLLNDTFAACRKTIGDENYAKLFGRTTDVNLADPGTFLKTYSR